MEKIEILRQKVKALYEAKHEGRAEWADWLYENHVFVVANNARELAERFGGDVDLAEAGGLLHDIADAVMNRFSDTHGTDSLAIARRLLRESDFTDGEIVTVVEDALPNHSCRPGSLPQSLEGRILATADAKAHLETDYYDEWYNLQLVSDTPKEVKRGTPEEVVQSALEKIERDFNAKIFFPEIKEELKEAYEARKKEFEIE